MVPQVLQNVTKRISNWLQTKSKWNEELLSYDPKQYTSWF